MLTRVPLNLFYSYAHEDAALREQLEIHLSLLRRQGLISEWHDRKIVAGTPWAQEIDAHLERASIILLLISPNFLASDYCYDVEMQRALERHQQNEARVIPIILRPCDWQDALFAHLQALPHDGKAVTEWTNQDAAFRDIARGIRTTTEQSPSISSQPELVSAASRTSPTTRARAPLSRLSSIEQQNRERLIQRVRSFWIEGVFEQSLYNAALMTLGLQQSPEAVENPWRLVLQESEHASTPLLTGTRITEVYNNAGGELLILGEPGAGKTTLLLELARDLLQHSEQEQTHPIPVVFNLSSWTRKRQPLTAWLIEEMETKYQVPRKVGSDWINANQILPLLDGLDEVEATHRPTCMQAINEYHQARSLIPLVVCSRVNEYMSQANRLALYRAITIQPLTTEQTNEYLVRIGEQVASLHVAFQNDPVLQELATTPLMLTILIMAYQGSSLEEIRGSVSAEARQQQIFRTYTQRMLRRRSVRSHYSSQHTIHWLSYLARQMKQQGQTEFFLERMQPDWLSTSRSSLFHGIFNGFIYGLIIALSHFLIYGWIRSGDQPAFTFNERLVISLIIGTLFGFSFSFLCTQNAKIQSAKNTIQLHYGNLSKFLRNRHNIAWIAGLTNGVLIWIVIRTNNLVKNFDHASNINNNTIYALMIGLAVGGLAWLGFEAFLQFDVEIKPVETVVWSWKAFWRGSIIFLGIGIIAGSLLILFVSWYWYEYAYWYWYNNQWNILHWVWPGLPGTALAIALGGGLFSALSQEMLNEQDLVAPNQGIRYSIRNSILIGLVFGTAFTLAATIFCFFFFAPSSIKLITAFEQYGIYSGVIVGLASGLRSGGIPSLQHFVLRFLLWRAQCVPFNYPRFLDYAAERILLRKVGGGYIFIHRLLLEYFASLEEK